MLHTTRMAMYGRLVRTQSPSSVRIQISSIIRPLNYLIWTLSSLPRVVPPSNTRGTTVTLKEPSADSSSWSSWYDWARTSTLRQRRCQRCLRPLRPCSCSVGASCLSSMLRSGATSDTSMSNVMMHASTSVPWWTTCTIASRRRRWNQVKRTSCAWMSYTKFVTWRASLMRISSSVMLTWYFFVSRVRHSTFQCWPRSMSSIATASSRCNSSSSWRPSLA